MAHTIVLGMQWGDEGKGKIVDLICPAFDAVIRYQGGHNAGHTVKFADRHFALHFLPSGAVHDGMHCVLGNGMVVAPGAFFEELDDVAENGVDLDGRLHLSNRAHVILPLHVALDAAREAALGDAKIGTTVRGIGPAYETKAARLGVRVHDLLAERSSLEAKLERLIDWARPQLEALGHEDDLPSVAALASECRAFGERLAPYVRDTATMLHDWIEDGEHQLLFEGAQGALLDLDHGTYPFVTSSNATAGGVATGTGVPPTRIDAVLGVIKAYTTRVGEGPFVTELHDEIGEHLRSRGNEFGTTTGRPRRCGWFDAVAARHSCRLNGTTALALTKLDVLDELDEIRVCVAYHLDGEALHEIPADLDTLARVEPIYQTVPGWKRSTEGVLTVEDLPEEAADYLGLLQDLVGAPVALISMGPRREETILVEREETHALLGDRLDAVRRHRDGTS